MARTPISKTLRERIRKRIESPGSYSGSGGDGGLNYSMNKAMSDTRRMLAESDSQNTESRAGWLASIGEVFGLGGDEEETTQRETPSSTYDETGMSYYTGSTGSQSIADGGNFDYNAVQNVSAMADDSFTQSAEQVAANLNIPVNWMYAVMDTESGFDPQIRNQEYVRAGREDDAAIGIIQFMPATAEALGTTVDELKTMSRTEQLTYVERFYEQYADKIQSPEDLYVATFYPRALGEEDDFVLGSERSQAVVDNIVEGNSALDANEDGRITLGEVKQWYRNSRGYNNFVAPFQSN